MSALPASGCRDLPVLRERGQAGVAQLDLLQHLIAQQAAQARPSGEAEHGTQ